jgi:hypothetical protein
MLIAPRHTGHASPILAAHLYSILTELRDRLGGYRRLADAGVDERLNLIKNGWWAFPWMVALMHFKHSPDGSGCLFYTIGSEKVWIGPHLTEMAIGSRWTEDENDQFPSDQQWSDAFEQMITWFAGKFPTKYYGRVITRLRGTRRSRDETFAEIIAAYFIEHACGYSVIDWEPEFAQGNTADFTIVAPLQTHSAEILVEVKAPSWTRERADEIQQRIETLEVRRLSSAGQDSAELDACLAKEKESLRGINSERKYGDHLKGGSYDFRDDLERALIKTCFADDSGTVRLPSDRPTLLIIVDDLYLGMQEPGGEFTVKRSLYHRPRSRVYPSGLFLDTRFNRLAGLATMEKVWLYERSDPKRFFTVFPHFWALPACCLPDGAFSKFLADLSQFQPLQSQ